MEEGYDSKALHKLSARAYAYQCCQADEFARGMTCATSVWFDSVDGIYGGLSAFPLSVQGF